MKKVIKHEGLEIEMLYNEKLTRQYNIYIKDLFAGYSLRNQVFPENRLSDSLTNRILDEIKIIEKETERKYGVEDITLTNSKNRRVEQPLGWGNNIK